MSQFFVMQETKEMQIFGRRNVFHDIYRTDISVHQLLALAQLFIFTACGLASLIQFDNASSENVIFIFDESGFVMCKGITKFPCMVIFEA